MEIFNTAIIETAKEILGKHQRPNKPWVTTKILEMCDKRRELKKNKKNPEGNKKYKEVNNKIRSELRKAKELWIEQQCTEIEQCLERNSTKKAYQVTKYLTTRKGRPSSIQKERWKKPHRRPGNS